MNDIDSRLEDGIRMINELVIRAERAEAHAADAIETGRQWETIARQIVAEVDAHFAETTRYQFSPKVRLERIRDLAAQPPTPTDGP